MNSSIHLSFYLSIHKFIHPSIYLSICPLSLSNHPIFILFLRSVVLDDLEDIFTEELASIESMMEARQNRDEESEQRIKRENEEINIIEKKAMKVHVHACS